MSYKFKVRPSGLPTYRYQESGAEIQIQPAGRPVLNPILKTDTVNSFFVPTLTEEGAKSAISTTKLPAVSHSTALGVTTEDWPGKRRKGSGFCELQTR